MRDRTLPECARVRAEALSADTPKLARVPAVAPDDGAFRLIAERADGRRLTERDHLEDAGQRSLFGVVS